MFETIDKFIEQFPTHITFLNTDHNNSELVFGKDPSTGEMTPIISNSPIEPHEIVDVTFQQYHENVLERTKRVELV